MAGQEQTTRRIVLLGKTGSGKSSLANTLLGERDKFKVGYSAISKTKNCQAETRTIDGRKIQLIDTPGFFDTDPNSNNLNSEILKCIKMCDPGPHAFLFVIQMGTFTVLEETVVALMLNYFSEEALRYTTVVFTHGDQLPEGMKIEEWAGENTVLRDLLQKCGGRCHVIDNKYWNNSQDPYRNNQYQIRQLLNTIDQQCDNGKTYYTNEMMSQLTSNNDDSKQEQGTNKSVWKYVAAGILVGAFLGAFTGVGVVYLISAKTCAVAVSGGIVTGGGVATATAGGVATATAGGVAASCGAASTGGVAAVCGAAVTGEAVGAAVGGVVGGAVGGLVGWSCSGGPGEASPQGSLTDDQKKAKDCMEKANRLFEKIQKYFNIQLQ